MIRRVRTMQTVDTDSRVPDFTGTLLVELELHLAVRAKGMLVETPGVRL